MGETKIEWATTVWNPVTGCSPVSEGCEHCWARRRAQRLRGRCGYPKDDPFRVTLHEDRLEQPLHWRKPRTVFVCSMGDLFHENVPFEFVNRVFGFMASSIEHTFMLLTKRPNRMKAYVRWAMDNTGEGYLNEGNVWLGVSVENQARADERIPLLLKVPAAVRFVSIEPMLGPVDLTNVKARVRHASEDPRYPNPAFVMGTVLGSNGRYFTPGGALGTGLDWVIVGGESGPGARPMHPDWVKDVREQCQAAGVPFFFKQWGGVNKKAAGRLLDGREWNEMPERKGGGD